MSKATVLTNDLLKGVMTDALVYRGYFYDIDTLFTPGIYSGSAGEATGTFPSFTGTTNWDYGVIEVFMGRPPRIYQRITSENASVAIRVWRDGKWFPWKLIVS